MRPIITDQVAWSVGRSVCWSVTLVSPAKTDQPIEMPFGLRIPVSLRNHVLDGRLRQLLIYRRHAKATFTENSRYFTGSIARSATSRYLIYSEADFEVFRPTGATRCTDWGEIWRGGGDLAPRQIPLPQSVQRLGYTSPKTEICTEI